MPKILGIDLALNNTGYALLSNRVLYKNKKGVIRVKNIKDLDEKLFRVCESLLKIINKEAPDLIVVESTPFSNNIKTTRLLSIMEGALRLSLKSRCQFPFVFVPVSTVRSCIGLKSKEDVFDFIVKKYKLNLSFDDDNDITDAIACALYGLECYEQ